eukprot:512843-Pleurochrysis_carterae.AAC.1
MHTYLLFQSNKCAYTPVAGDLLRESASLAATKARAEAANSAAAAKFDGGPCFLAWHRLGFFGEQIWALQ